MPEETQLLNPQLKIMFYEALGNMISAENNLEYQELMLNRLLEHQLEFFFSIYNVQMSEDTLVEDLTYFLRVNERVCFSSGYCYIAILSNLIIIFY